MNRLLIVDDDAGLRQMLGWDLEELGYAVTLAQDCREALAVACDGGFDLALLDYCLPDGNGIALMQALRRDVRPPAVVLYSGMVGPDTLARGLDAGAAGFLVKPVSVARLHQVFQLALSA